MDVDVNNLYSSIEEIKGSFSLTSSENGEDLYYLPTDEEAKEIETIFSLSGTKKKCEFKCE